MGTPTPAELQRKWNAQLKRTDIFEDNYVPSVGEQRQLMTLALSLGFVDESEKCDNTGTILPLRESFCSNNDKLRRIFGCTDRPSVILCRGPVRVNGRKHELILCTEGFVLARVETSYWTTDKLVTPLIYEAGDLYECIECLEDRYDVPGEPISLVDKDLNDVVSFICKDVDLRDAWWATIAQVLVQHRLRTHGKERRWFHGDWQERLIVARQEEDPLAKSDHTIRALSTRMLSVRSHRGSRRTSMVGTILQSLATEEIPIDPR